MTNTKKKHGNKMKLMSAIGMLTVSAAMLVSSTFAWFSMNKDVTATSMSVTAKSDATFLMIKQGTADADTVQAGKKIIDNAVTASAELYPTAHEFTPSASVGISAIEAADTTVATDYKDWYYRYSSSPDSATDTMTAKTKVPIANNGEYILINEFSLAVADGSNDLSSLRVKSCTINVPTGAEDAVRVLVAGANGSQEFAATTAADISTTSTVLQTANVTSSASSTVKIYVYWDGNDEGVYTNNIANLQGTSVEVTFTGDIVPAT